MPQLVAMPPVQQQHLADAHKQLLLRCRGGRKAQSKACAFRLCALLHAAQHAGDGGLGRNTGTQQQPRPTPTQTKPPQQLGGLVFAGDRPRDLKFVTEAADRDDNVRTPAAANVSDAMRALLPLTPEWTSWPDYDRVRTCGCVCCCRCWACAAAGVGAVELWLWLRGCALGQGV